MRVMNNTVSVNTCDLTMYGGLCSNPTMDYPQSTNIEGDISTNNTLESNLLNQLHVPPDLPQQQAEDFTSDKMEVTGKYSFNADILDIGDKYPKNYGSQITPLTAIKAFVNQGSPCRDNQELNDLCRVTSSNFQCNYDSQNEEDQNYQLVELQAVSKKLSEPCKDNHNEVFLHITDGEVIIATLPSVKFIGSGDQSKFVCCHCGSTFLDSPTVLSHLASHQHLKPFQCVSCDLFFSTEVETRTHFKTHSVRGSSPFNESSSSIIETCIDHESQNFHSCSNCKRTFESLENLSLHKELCCKSSSNPTTVQLINNSGPKSSGGKERKWVCQTCEKAFRSSKDLKEHAVVHTGARDFPCAICGKAFGTATNMRNHLMTHSDQKPFACMTCGATFRQKDSLKVHARKHTGERPYVCSVCKMSFDRNFTFKNHMLTHFGKSFVCSVCGKAFSTRGGLNNHERLHFKDPSQPGKKRQPRSKSGAGKWVCDECGKIYSTRSNLKLHKKSHEPGQVCHVCPVCSKVYKSRDSMEVHMRRHNEERRFQCTMCPRSFYRNYTLKLHILTHTGEKPHSCPVEGCTKSFAQTSSLSYHIRKNHKNKEESSVSQSNNKRTYKKRKTVQASSEVVTSDVNLNDSGSITNGEIVSASDRSLVQGLKLNSNISESIINRSVVSMLDDMAQHIHPSLPAVWDENESVEMLGVVSGLHQTSQHQDHTVGIDLQHQQCRQVPLLEYVPSDTLPLLVSVPNDVLYDHDTVHKALIEQPMLVPHLP